MPTFPFCGGSFPAQSPNADLQRSINLYPEINESGSGISKLSMYGTPGITLFTTLPAGAIRGLWAGENRLFAAAGSRLYEVFSDGTYHDRGDIGNDGQPVQMFPNGNQLLIISAGYAWIDNGSGPVKAMFGLAVGYCSTAGTAVTWDSGDPFSSFMTGGSVTVNGVTYPGNSTIQINGVNYTVDTWTNGTQITLASSAGNQSNVPFIYSGYAPVPASQGAFLDGFYIVCFPSSNQFYLSSLFDGTHWDITQFATKQGYPDNIAAMLADHEELWLFGDEGTIEVWQDTGATPLPFQRDPGAFIHYSCQAPWSPARFDNGVSWIGGDQERGGPICWYAQGFQPNRISNHAVEQVWASYPTISDAVTYSYIDAGHPSLVINFPSGNATWCYDGATQMWHERAWWNGTANVRQRQMFHSSVPLGALPSKHYVGDWENGNIYVMSRSTYTDNGTQIVRQRIAPHLSNEEKHIFFGKFQVEMEVGNGTLNPKLEYSDDHGHTFINPRIIAVGAAGQYKARAVWWMNGHSRDRVWRLTISDALPVAITNAFYEAVAGYG